MCALNIRSFFYFLLRSWPFIPTDQSLSCMRTSRALPLTCPAEGILVSSYGPAPASHPSNHSHPVGCRGASCGQISRAEVVCLGWRLDLGHVGLAAREFRYEASCAPVMNVQRSRRTLWRKFVLLPSQLSYFSLASRAAGSLLGSSCSKIAA